MRIFISVLILIFSLQSWTKANDISEFEIEGFYVGKSLLDYYQHEKINEEINSRYSYTYPDKEFTILGVGYGTKFYLSLPQRPEKYDELGITIKQSDKNYKIYSISGEIYCGDNIDKCFKKEKQIVSDLKQILTKNIEFEEIDFKHPGDPSGESMVYANSFYFKTTDDSISVKVYEWGKKEKQDGNVNVLKVSISLKEYLDYLTVVFN